MTAPQKSLAEKHSTITIQNRIIFEARDVGCDDIEGYFDLLKNQITKLQETNKLLNEELQKANIKIDELNGNITK